MQDIEKQPVPDESTVHKLSFEWLQTGVSSTDLKVRNTVIDLMLTSAIEERCMFTQAMLINLKAGVELPYESDRGDSMLYLLELVSLRGENEFEPHPHNKIQDSGTF